MDKYIKDLQEELASKMATNDLPYDYRVRCISEYTEKIVKLFAIPDVSKRCRSEAVEKGYKHCNICSGELCKDYR